MTARELRVWHWRKVMSYRAAAQRYPWRAKAANKAGDFHIGAVQVLNDHPECIAAGTSAEFDSAQFPLPANKRPLPKVREKCDE